MTRPRAKLIPILIASTLKAIRDVRAFEKLALSLGETNKYRLNIIGFSLKKPKSEGNFRFFSSMSHFDSFSDRILAQVRFARAVFQTRPKLIISCTYEYLPLATLLKSIFGFKLVYDVQENYLVNLDLNPSHGKDKLKLGKRVIAWADSLSSVDLFLLAEKCYQFEMPKKQPFLILENKFAGPKRTIEPKSFQGKNTFKFCITGTITPAYGILDGVKWYLQIEKRFPGSSLVVCGHIPIKSFQEELEVLASKSKGMQLKVSRDPIPHDLLLEELEKADFAILPYPSIPAFKDKIPTKLFECAALGIPVLISPNPNWENFHQSFQGGSAMDFTELNAAVTQFDQVIGRIYFSTPVPDSVLWTREKLHFQEAIANLLS